MCMLKVNINQLRELIQLILQVLFNFLLISFNDSPNSIVFVKAKPVLFLQDYPSSSSKCSASQEAFQSPENEKSWSPCLNYKLEVLLPTLNLCSSLNFHHLFGT